MQNTTCFITGCARSGTTSLSKILSTAINGISSSEPVPTLARESGQYISGQQMDIELLLDDVIGKRIREAHSQKPVYIEKQATLAPFLQDLHRLFDARFLWVIRDGRDVVSSLINWHEKKFGNIYRECREVGDISVEAISQSSALLNLDDDSDHNRPRPDKGSPLYQTWCELPRAEMCAWYWSTINRQLFSEFEALPATSVMRVDYTCPVSDDIRKVFEFCGLLGFHKERVNSLLDQKINSNRERNSADGTFPRWEDWDGGMRRRFEALAGEAMRQFGYSHGDSQDWKPLDFGRFWSKNSCDDEWYSEIFSSRLKAHQDFLSWIESLANVETIVSIAEFGCGTGFGYREKLSSFRYVGVDGSPSVLKLAKHLNENPDHFYYIWDFVAQPIPETCDVVFSQGTIDNVYDIDACISSMVKSARKWIYFTAYRGWFPLQEEHHYSYNSEDGIFYNDLSGTRINDLLEMLGCTDISIERLYVGKPDILFETRVIARVPENQQRNYSEWCQ